MHALRSLLRRAPVPAPLLSCALALALLSGASPARQDVPPAGAARPASGGQAADTAPEPVRRPADWNLGDGKLALGGYDPVAYFPEGGGKPVKGSRELALEHDGAVYRFASESNRESFRAAPARYEPAYGGWCAWAMAQGDGEKVEVDPGSFLVQDGRLLVFYDGFFADTRKSWQKGDPPALARSADANWERMTGESPRRGPDPMPGPAGDGAGIAPDFSLSDPSGRMHRLADLRGRVVVLDFWATWCGPCRAAMPGVQALHERYAGRPVSVYGVNVAERSPDADPVGYMREQGYTYTMLHGTDAVSRAYGVEALPTFVVIGPDGREVARHVGGGAEAAKALVPLIDAALPAQPAAPADG